MPEGGELIPPVPQMPETIALDPLATAVSIVGRDEHQVHSAELRRKAFDMEDNIRCLEIVGDIAAVRRLRETQGWLLDQADASLREHLKANHVPLSNRFKDFVGRLLRRS